MFGWGNSVVDNLVNDYADLVADLKTTIQNLKNKRDTMNTDAKAVHDRMLSYTDGKGKVAQLYYTKIEESKEKFTKIKNELNATITALESKKTEADRKYNQLKGYQRKEKNREEDYKLSEIHLS